MLSNSLFMKHLNKKIPKKISHQKTIFEDFEGEKSGAFSSKYTKSNFSNTFISERTSYYIHPLQSFARSHFSKI